MAGTPEWRRNAEARVPASGHPLFCGGPILTGHMERFAAKFGFAMHYEVAGVPIGADGAVAARWYSNADVFEGRFPTDVWDVLGSPATLRQGKRHVTDQFEYAWAVDGEGAMGMFLGTFRQSFAIIAFTTTSHKAVFDDPPVPLRLWRPGCFKVT